MKDNANKEEWINGVMNSTSGMSKALPPQDLYEKVISKLDNAEHTNVTSIPIRQWAVAAAVLLALNIGSAIYFASRNNSAEKTNTTNPLATEMQLGTTYNY